jgi:hypothetical protein
MYVPHSARGRTGTPGERLWAVLACLDREVPGWGGGGWGSAPYCTAYKIPGKAEDLERGGGTGWRLRIAVEIRLIYFNSRQIQPCDFFHYFQQQAWTTLIGIGLEKGLFQSQYFI